MILHALKDYYERKTKDEKGDMPLFGFSIEKIDYELVINEKGEKVQISDLTNYDGKKKVRTELNVPKIFQGKKGSGIKPNFLWEETGYVFGYDPDSPERATEKHDAFKAIHSEIGQAIDDKGMKAVFLFLEKWKPEETASLTDWDKLKGKKLVFRLDGEKRYVFQRQTVKEALLQYMGGREGGDGDSYIADCLITGEEKPIALLHDGIKGIKASEHSSNVLIGFQKQKTAFCSYGKDGLQGYNSPVSQIAAFQYTTALNYLINTAKQCVHDIGDATTVFWAGEETPAEGIMAQLWNPQEEDKGTVVDVRLFLKNLRDGKKVPDEFKPKAKFYILGLSPNASRLSVRFWYAGDVKDILQRIGMHFRDIHIEKERETDEEFPAPLWWRKGKDGKAHPEGLLLGVAVMGKIDNIPPLLGGELMRSILTEGKYPESMLSALIGRIRVGEEINYLRAAMIKGILTRNHKMEVSMSLDLTNKEPAYLLGRLFAVLEKAQQDALGDINATIKDKYFSSASATPCAVFPILLNLNKHHTSKGEYGGYYDDLNAKIMEELPAKKFPTHLRLEEQGLFSIGYYHQRNDFYKSECVCGRRFSSFEASEKPNEKAKSGYKIVACPECGGSVEVKKQKSKEDKQQESETN